MEFLGKIDNLSPRHFHDGDVLRVEVAEGRCAKGAQDAGRDRTGAGAGENAFSGVLGVHGND